MADIVIRPLQEARHDQPVGDAHGGGRLHDVGALRPLADDHQPEAVGNAAHRADQHRQVLDGAQARQCTDDDLLWLTDEARDALGVGIADVEFGVDAVGNAVHAGRGLFPGLERDRLQDVARHRQRVRRGQGDAAIDVALDLEAPRLVGVEAVLVMDQRRRALGIYAPRHHTVDRAPIVRQHQIETAHIGRDRLVPLDRGLAGQRRGTLRDLVADALGDRIARAQFVGHGGDDGVLRGIAKGVHQRNRARLLPPSEKEE